MVAYVAMPDAEVSPPDKPPGWDPPSDNPWPHPGPPPPGYTPDYSLSLDGPGAMYYYEAINSTVTLRDHDDYGTTEPSGSQITWSAYIWSTGESIGLRFQGESTYEDSIVSSYSQIGDFWGASPNIECDLEIRHDDEYLVLTTETEINDNTISQNAFIKVREERYGLVIHHYFTPDEADIKGVRDHSVWGETRVITPDDIRAYYFSLFGDLWLTNGESYWDTEWQNAILVDWEESDYGDAWVDVEDLSSSSSWTTSGEDVASVEVKLHHNYMGGSLSVRVTTTRNEHIIDSERIDLSLNSDDWPDENDRLPWIEIGATTDTLGQITVINP